MKPKERSISTNTQDTPCQVTDVLHFFSEIIEEYVHFQECVLHLDHKIPTSSPLQILDGCEKIRQKQNDLAVLDQQLLDIINLAGNEIANEPIVHDYRVAFAHANMACNNLYQSLKALKCSLEEKKTPTFSKSC